MSDGRSLVRKIGLVGITDIISRLSALILVPILTKTLPVDDYGLYVILVVTISLIPQVVLLGIPSAMARFLPTKSKREELRESFYSLAIVVLIIGGIASIVLFALSDFIADLIFKNDILIAQTLAAIVLIECMFLFYSNLFLALLQIRHYSLMLISKIVLNIILISYFVLAGQGIVGVIIGMMISSLAIVLVTTIYIVRQIGIGSPRFSSIKEYLIYGIPTIPASLSSWVVRSSDRYIIGLLLGAAFVAYYSPAYTMASIIAVFIAPLTIILPPALAKLYDEYKVPRMEVILSKALKYFLLIAIPSAFGISLLSEPILRIITTPEIASNGYMITPFVAFATILQGVYFIFSNAIYVTKRTKLLGSMWIVAAIINVSLNLLLIPYLGIIAAATTTVIAFGFTAFATAYFCSLKFKVSIDTLFIAKSVLASVLMSSILLLWGGQDLIEIVIEILVCTGVYFALMLIMKGLTLSEARKLIGYLI
jgi:O-antigen/teichoic acid export membrane protein